MFFKKCNLLIIFSLIATLAFGQNVEKLEKKAQKYFYAEDLIGAAQIYEELLNIDAENRTAAYRLIICNALLEPRNSPIEDLLQYKSTQGKRDKFYYYWLGRAYFHQNQFKKAYESWNKFLTVDKYKSSVIISETEYFMDWAERAEIHHSFSENYEIDQLPESVNGAFTEYSPVYFGESNELLFLSDRKGIDESQPFQVYHSTRTAEQWSPPTLLTHFGLFAERNANLEVVNQSSKLYLYKGDKHGSLYVSHSDNGKWNKPVSLSREISDAKLESHFFINEQENTILYAHRKKGKSADLDLFVSRLNLANHHWSKPELLSTVLTSDLDEDYPYLSPDGKTIYFSSKGFGSIGGYDVFKSEFNAETNTWSIPITLGYPTNSIGDDIQFKIDGSTNSGYFVSDRLSSFGGFDIYFFHESNKILLTGHVMESSGLPADHAEIHFYPSRKTGLEIKTMTDVNGKYEVRLGNDDQINVEILFHDELVHTEVVQTPSAEQQIMRKNFDINSEKGPVDDSNEYHDPMYTDLESIATKFRESNKALLSNIYFDFGDYKLDDQDQTQLNPLVEVMAENPNLHVEIGGHTDAIGDREVNLSISYLRAQSVVQFLLDNGIASDQVVAKGYGEDEPMASNDQEKEGREFNRRIEVLVLE